MKQPVFAVFLSLLFAACHPPLNPDTVSGTIETDEVHVASRYGGRVTALPVREGDGLKTGQLIAELDAPELRAARAQVVAQLAEWEAGARREELEATRNDAEAVASELEFARSEEKRVRELASRNVSTPSDLDRAMARVRTLGKNLAAANSRHQLLLAGTRPERIAQTRAGLEELDAQLTELRVSAPTNCIVEVLSVKIGDVLAPNREIATLLLADQLWVRVFVPQPWLGHIRVGEIVKVRADAYPDHEFTGTVEQINRQAEFTPRNVQTVGDRIKQVFGIKVRLVDDSDRLRAGMSLDVAFPNLPTHLVHPPKRK